MMAFPYLDAANRDKYKFTARGDGRTAAHLLGEAYSYIAKGHDRHCHPLLQDKKASDLLRQQGYPEEMIEAMGGAGTRTFKCRGGMGLLGVIGKYGMYRFSNGWRCSTRTSAAWTSRSQGRPHLVELHLARRPGPRPSLHHRPASLGRATSTTCATRGCTSSAARTWSRTRWPSPTSSWR
jgi:hypothetical protein